MARPATCLTVNASPCRVGSRARIVNSAGVIQSTQHYYPFGGNRGGAFSTLTTKRFTGQYHESSIPGGEGLYYYNARWYDARLGRFASADTLVPEPGNPQSFNRYSYVYNNPVRYNDPSGHNPACMSAGAFPPVALLCEAAMLLSQAASQIGPQIAQYGPQASQLAQQWGDKIPAAVDWLLNSGKNSGNTPQNVPQGGGNTAGPGGLDPNHLEQLKTLAQTAQQRIGDSRGKISEYTGREYAEATLADGSIITHSGSDAQTAAGGYAKGIQAANRLAKQIGFKFPDYGFATHAEVKLAALAPNQPIAVSRPMCSVCMSFFQQLANHTGITQVVADPIKVHTFIPK